MGRSPTCEPHRHDQTSPNMQIHSHTPHQLPNASNVQIATFCHNLEAVCIGRVQLTSNQHLQSQRLQTARCPQPTRACSLASGLGYPQAACTSRSTCCTAAALIDTLWPLVCCSSLNLSCFSVFFALHAAICSGPQCARVTILTLGSAGLETDVCSSRMAATRRFHHL